MVILKPPTSPRQCLPERLACACVIPCSFEQVGNRLLSIWAGDRTEYSLGSTIRREKYRVPASNKFNFTDTWI